MNATFVLISDNPGWVVGVAAVMLAVLVGFGVWLVRLTLTVRAHAHTQNQMIDDLEDLLTEVGKVQAAGKRTAGMQQALTALQRSVGDLKRSPAPLAHAITTPNPLAADPSTNPITRVGRHTRLGS